MHVCTQSFHRIVTGYEIVDGSTDRNHKLNLEEKYLSGW